MRVQRDLPRPEARVPEARPQAFLCAGFDGERAAAGPEPGQFGAQVRGRSQRAPLLPVPAERAARLLPILEANERGDGLDPESERVFELRIIDNAGHTLREVRVVLAHDAEVVHLVEEAPQDGFDQAARRAVLLHDGNEVARGDRGQLAVCGFASHAGRYIGARRRTTKRDDETEPEHNMMRAWLSGLDSLDSRR